MVLDTINYSEFNPPTGPAVALSNLTCSRIPAAGPRVRLSVITWPVDLFDKFGLKAKFITKSFSLPTQETSSCLLRGHTTKLPLKSGLFCTCDDLLNNARTYFEKNE